MGDFIETITATILFRGSVGDCNEGFVEMVISCNCVGGIKKLF